MADLHAEISEVRQAAVRKIISMACGVAGLKFGTDLRVELGE